jgi:hypothetical protein
MADWAMQSGQHRECLCCKVSWDLQHVLSMDMLCFGPTSTDHADEELMLWSSASARRANIGRPSGDALAGHAHDNFPWWRVCLF